MKKMNFNLIVLMLGLTLVLFNCKKKDDPEGDPTPSCTNYITQEDIIIIDSTNSNAQSTGMVVYSFNSSNKVRKITRSSGGTDTQYDSLYYNTDGTLDSVATVNLPSTTLNATQKYNYSGGKLTSINETGTNGNGAYERTRTFTYNGSELSGMTVSYTTGSAESDELTSLSSITYTNGNITSGNGGTLGTVTVQYDAYPNPYKNLGIYSDDPLKLFSSNNATVAYSSLAPTTPIFSTEYTYQDGKVKTTKQGEVGNYSETRTLTISCK